MPPGVEKKKILIYKLFIYVSKAVTIGFMKCPTFHTLTLLLIVGTFNVKAIYSI